MEVLDIVGVGLATIDIVIRLKDMPTWERTYPLSAFIIDGGGPVATACVAASRLGARVGYVGTFGNDLLGEIKLRSLKERGVDLSRVIVRQATEGQVVLVYVHEETGERSFSGLRAWDHAPLRVDELDREYITSAQFLHLDGAHHEAALTAAKWMKAAGKMVSLDCSKTDGGAINARTLELVGLTDILICGSGFGLSVTGYADPFQAGRAMLSMGPRLVVQTEGKEGSYTVSKEGQFHLPAVDVNVVDTTGAGDVFHGAYLVGLLQGWDALRVAQFATAAAAIKCTKLGGRNGIPTFDETMEFLKQHSYRF